MSLSLSPHGTGPKSPPPSPRSEAEGQNDEDDRVFHFLTSDVQVYRPITCMEVILPSLVG